MPHRHPRPVDALRGRRVLVVEDEVLVAMDLESELERQGCIVLGPAPTVARALAVIDQEQPHIALLDLNLAGKSTGPVALALATHGIPFVVVSGYSSRLTTEPALQVAPRVDKPVNYRKLVEALAQALAAD